MRQPRRTALLAAIVAAVPLLLAPAAEAKILPYDLRVEASGHRVGERVLVVMDLHPQNVLPVWFDFEIRWTKLRPGQKVANAVRRPGNPIVMMQVGEQEYHGAFAVPKPGRYAVYGQSAVGAGPGRGYPRAIVFRVVR
jgi:hypothetical protein